MNLYKYASPAAFYPLAGRLIPWFAVPSVILFAVSFYFGFFLAPSRAGDQNQVYHIIYIHVAAAWMGMFLYVLMAIYAGIGWAFNARLASMMASSLSITGAMFTFLSLVTGSLWGKPTWGTWWVWDARITSVLVLFFLYMGVIALYEAFENKQAAAKACAVLSLVGLVNIPIIYWSVEWWFSLHQPATLKIIGKSTMAPSMLYPLLVMVIG